jgi:hypothetical protein
MRISAVTGPSPLTRRPVRISSFVLIILLSLGMVSGVFLLSPQHVSAETLNSWTATANYPEVGEYSPQSCVTWDSYIYCVAGDTSDYAPLSSSGVGTWTATTGYPEESYMGSTGQVTDQSCVAYGGYIYCVGGYIGGGSAYNGVFYATLSSSGIGTWTETTGLGTDDGMSNMGCVASSGYIYCVGGFSGPGVGEGSEVIYAPLSSSGVGTWTTSPNQYPITDGSPICVTSGGDIYCVGGWAGNEEYTNLAYYAPISSAGVGTWTSTTTYPTYDGYALSPNTCVVSGDYGYCIGGTVGDADNSNAVYYASVSSSGIGTWTATTSYPNGSETCVTSSGYIYCGGSVSAYAQISEPASSTSQVTVNSQNTSGASITGYYVVLYGSGGSVAGSGFTPDTFTTTVGSAYTLQADGYGSCTFASWSDGVTSNPRSFTATSSPQTFTAVYNCSGTTSSSSSVIVDSQNQAGAAITGYYTILYGSSGSVDNTGFTPATFSTTSGDAYSVQVDNYGSCTFTSWSDGVTSNPRSFTASASTTTFTAVYDCSGTTSTTSSVTVNSVNQDGTAITGYRVVLYSSTGTVISDGFTPDTFATTVGQSYQVGVENYGSCTFTNWSGGATADPMTFTATSSAQTFTAEYNCG